jgi:hypothetical protein
LSGKAHHAHLVDHGLAVGGGASASVVHEILPWVGVPDV